MGRSKRDDFTKPTIEALADRAGNRCSNPYCRKPTSGPRTDPTKAVNIGVAAHITAAAEEGPRYDPTLTPEERRHPDNGLWLCQNCAKLIDNDPHRYPVDLLHQWKKQAEQMARDELEQRAPVLDRLTEAITGGTEAQRALRNRQAMLQVVKNTWVKGVLEQSLHGAAMIELGMEERADAVERPWDMIVQMPGQPNRPLPHGTRLLDVFDEMNQTLLILGKPGSGKTTMLLELARDAIARGQLDPAQSIAVVFHLSSWTERRQPLAVWVVEELKAKYRITRRIGRTWVEQDAMLLLLDGLDEVDAAHRGACVEAINEHSKKYGLGGVVVCSRTAEYEALGTKLKLGGAILLRPLTARQVNDYLAAAGPRLDTLRTGVQHDATLQELARTPLMLSVMALAYRDIPAEALTPPQPYAPGASRQQLFAAYVERMFTRLVRATRESYSRGQTVTWLAWLAQRMGQHSQSIFLLEGLQPSWLGTRAQRWLYAVGSRAIRGLLIGLAMLLLGNSVISALDPIFIAGGLAAGISVGLVDGVRFERDGRKHASRRSEKQEFWPFIIYITLVGLSATFSCALGITLLQGDWELDVLYGNAVLGSIMCGLPFGLVSGSRGRRRGVDTDVKTVESLSWSWRGFLLALLVLGLIPGAILLAIASSAYEPGVRLWDGRDGAPIATLKGHTDDVNSGSLSPDGTRIVTAGRDGTARLWDGRDGAPIAILEGHTDDVNSGSFSPDGSQIVTASHDGTARLWDGRDGAPIAILEGHTDYVHSASFSPDGTRIVTASSDHTARLWDGRDGAPIAILKVLGFDVVYSARFSPDGTRIVTASEDGTARLWDGRDGAPIAILEGHTDDVNSGSFSPDGSQIVTTSHDGTARLWDGRDGAPIAILKGHASWANLYPGWRWFLFGTWTPFAFTARFSPDGTRIVTASEDGTARLWDGRDGAPIAILEGHTDYVHSASFSPDGTRIVTASSDHTARLWDGRDGAPMASLKGHAAVWSACFSPDGTRIVATGKLSDLRPWVALWLVPGVILGFLAGLRRAVQKRKVSPNEGIWLSARNAALVALVLGLTSTLLLYAVMTVVAELAGLVALLEWGGLATLFGFVAVLTGLSYGGLDVLHHYLLRLILAANGQVPWHYVRFLDYASERILLRKVGGGYILIHRLLLDYFAKNAREAL